MVDEASEALASISPVVSGFAPPALSSLLEYSSFPSFPAPNGSSGAASGIFGVPPRIGVPAEDATVETSKSVSNSDGSASFSAALVLVLVEGFAEELRESGAGRRRELERDAPEVLEADGIEEPVDRLEE